MQLSTMQVINMDQFNSKVVFTHVFNNDNFIIGGKRFYYLYNEDAKNKIK